MMPDPIPLLNSDGVLPPYNPDAPTARDRSPYHVSLPDFVLRYAISPERDAILRGFLSYREALHACGLDRGFQWVDGSFLEDIELIAGRAPHDIDVVTFCHLPDRQAQQELARRAPRLFIAVHTKEDYRVDAHLVQLNSDAPEPLVNDSAYWYSLWSHRRTGQWKGYLQLDLSSVDDQTAQACLDSTPHQGGQV